mmetsp:Transcript_19291/g.25040  ORF Transcript_19291/g.25040 Transcript_19291/m.25040 type:complete len:247 (+) Transcript_19291:1927-2667(+)
MLLLVAGIVLIMGVNGFHGVPMIRRQGRVWMNALPEVELWLDLRTTLRSPESAIYELYKGVKECLTEPPPSGQAIHGVILWRDPNSEMPTNLGDLPIIVVDPKSESSSLSGLATAPHSSEAIGSISVLEPPFDSKEAVAALDYASCLVIDGGATGPDSWQKYTLPLIELLAAAAVGRSRILVSLFDPPQLSACTKALVLGGLAGAAMPKLDIGNNDEETKGRSDGLGVALPPDPRLWSHAVMYKSS